ncbi:MAG: sulfatase-like hydrolase/transferase [Deltaproteobacteria bacterium]|nr:sulfatase-like hydrolase/transferase [Deltaproteobacteria bacterium]
MNSKKVFTTLGLIPALVIALAGPASAKDIVHDAEYYILDAQNGEKWAAEDIGLDKKLAELKKKFGTPPNIIHIMWDDTAFGDIGIPAIQKIRGFETPSLNKMASEGILFTRMYTEVGCTPSRALPIRNGMYNIGMLRESHGLRDTEVTIAEVLSKEGYATAFHGKWHLGDIEESYPENQGFDETFYTSYNQIVQIWTRKGEASNSSIGMYEDMLPKDPYKLDDTFITKGNGWVMVAEGTKGGKTLQWKDNTVETYAAADAEAQRRTLDFIERQAKAGKPFYITHWPHMTMTPLAKPEKISVSRSMLQDGLQGIVDPLVGNVMAKLRELGIAENTLIVAMADNGPMSHHPPPAGGWAETIFRGGKGDFLEGGVRVAAQAWWPGTIKPQIVGDILHETDLYTTFARLGGALQHIPTDRIVDGVDQSALLINGDTHSRRDHVFIYAGPNLGATVKGNYKRHWMSSDPIGDASGIPAAFYFLPSDPREASPLLLPLIHLKQPFDRMRVRHELWIKKYPNTPEKHGIPFTGIANASPEVKALAKPPVDLKKLPFDPLEYIEHLDQLPFDPAMDPDL